MGGPGEVDRQAADGGGAGRQSTDDNAASRRTRSQPSNIFPVQGHHDRLFLLLAELVGQDYWPILAVGNASLIRSV
ncbi:MAG: hypothetical protein LBV30_09095 [Propionibacteriaceae bacterium]|jgi:hypothetical protein|nr:hypothetical protein [Propionibacteriaceae bacterium]